TYGETADDVAIIRAGPIKRASEGKPVVGDVDRVTWLHGSDVLGAPCGHGDDAEERDADTEMSDRRTPCRSGQARRAAERRAERHPQDHSAFGNIDDSPRHHEDCKPDAERRQHRTAVL